MSNMNSKPTSRVSSLAVSFKRATQVDDDADKVKLEHRLSLKSLIDDYMNKVAANKVDGIRTARELVEVIKLDLLLLGEATERTDDKTRVDEVRIQKLTRMLDENNEDVQAVIQKMFDSLNDTNDNIDDIAEMVEEEHEDFREYLEDDEPVEETLIEE